MHSPSNHSYCKWILHFVVPYNGVVIDVMLANCKVLCTSKNLAGKLHSNTRAYLTMYNNICDSMCIMYSYIYIYTSHRISIIISVLFLTEQSSIHSKLIAVSGCIMNDGYIHVWDHGAHCYMYTSV